MQDHPSLSLSLFSHTCLSHSEPYAHLVLSHSFHWGTFVFLVGLLAPSHSSSFLARCWQELRAALLTRDKGPGWYLLPSAQTTHAQGFFSGMTSRKVKSAWSKGMRGELSVNGWFHFSLSTPKTRTGRIHRQRRQGKQDIMNEPRTDVSEDDSIIGRRG